MFRAGFIDNNDIPWLYSYNDTNNDMIKNQSGVLNKFLLMFFESTGLGMIQEPFVKKVDSYEACKLGKLPSFGYLNVRLLTYLHSLSST